GKPHSSTMTLLRGHGVALEGVQPPPVRGKPHSSTMTLLRGHGVALEGVQPPPVRGKPKFSTNPLQSKIPNPFCGYFLLLTPTKRTDL
ncbi:MAG: hypothetical protein MUC66_07335, partial [Methanolinea sp.]|nr:hypothetical protein [Methanolinea sp.]